MATGKEWKESLEELDTTTIATINMNLQSIWDKWPLWRKELNWITFLKYICDQELEDRYKDVVVD